MRSSLAPLVAIALFTLLYLSAPLDTDSWWAGLLLSLVAILGAAPLAFRRSRMVASSERPVVAAVNALALLVSMVVLGFSSLYLVVNREADQFVDMATRLDAVYFTLTTLGTVGFGDVHPTGQLARGLVSMQIVFDLSLFAVSVRLLGTALRRRTGYADADDR